MGQEFDTVLAAAQAGGQWAFSLLYQQFNPKLLRYFAARAPSEADDLAADTWMGVARQLGGFSGDETGFRAWLFTIAHRQLVQHWRNSKKGGVAPGADQGGQEPATDDPESEVVAGMSAQEAVRRLAAVLSPEQAEVVLLRILGDLDVEQVARILGKRPGSIRSLQHRALKKLADQNFLVPGVTP